MDWSKGLKEKSPLGVNGVTLATKTDTYANSVDPDETAHNEPSHLDLHCCYLGNYH